MRACFRYSIVALLLLAIAIPPRQAVAGRTRTSNSSSGPMVMWEPEDPEAWSPDGRNQVARIIETMRSRINKIPPRVPLTPGLIAEVTAIYGPNGILTGHDGLTYRGDREISMYFNLLICRHRVDNLKIEIKFVYAKEFTERAKDLRGSPEDIIHSLYFILSCSYRLDGQLVDPPSATSCPHSRMCECSYGN